MRPLRRLRELCRKKCTQDREVLKKITRFLTKITRNSHADHTVFIQNHKQFTSIN